MIRKCRAHRHEAARFANMNRTRMANENSATLATVAVPVARSPIPLPSSFRRPRRIDAALASLGADENAGRSLSAQ
jgi:hypothetical protein